MDDDDEIDFIPTMPNPIVKEEPSDNFDFGETDEMSDCGNEIYDATSNDINMTTAQNTSENNIENESVDEQNTQNPMQIQSIYNNVAGYVHFTVDVIVLIFCLSSDTFHWALCFYIHLQDKFDRYFATADVTIPNSIWILLDFYNSNQTSTGAGELHDLKYVDLLLKGILGWEIMSEMDTDPDFEDPKLILAKGIFNLINMRLTIQ